MDRISMDALNTGWSVGPGTQVRTPNDDLDLLVAHARMAVPNARVPVSVAAFVSSLMTRAFIIPGRAMGQRRAITTLLRV